MKKRVLLLLMFFAVAIHLVYAQNESIVTLSGNAYITAGGTASIDEQNCAIRNWNDTESVISFYFRTEKSGKMNIALKAKGDSRIDHQRYSECLKFRQ